MADELAIKMTGEDAGVAALFERLNRLQDLQEKKLRELGVTSASVAREQAAMSREAARLLQQLASPQDQHNARVARYGELLKANELTEEKYAAAVQRSAERMKNEEQALNAASEAGRRAAAMDAERARILQQLQTPQDRHNERVRGYTELLKAQQLTEQQHAQMVFRSTQTLREEEGALTKNETALVRVGKAGDLAFGSAAVGMIKGWVAGIASGATVIHAVTQALTDMHEAETQAAEKQKGARFGIGMLAQLADTRAEMSYLVSQADKLRVMGGAENKDEAGRTIFAMASAGQLTPENVDLVGKLKATGMVQTPGEMIKSATTIQRSMGEAETGSMRQLISKGFAAATFAPSTAEALIAGASRAGAGARNLGLSDEEVFAAEAMTATTTGSAEHGGTQLRSLMRSLVKMQGGQIEAAEGLPGQSIEEAIGGKPEFNFKGKTLLEMLHQIRDAQIVDQETGKLRPLTEPERMKIFGRQEGYEAYKSLLSQEDTYRKALDATRGVSRRDVIGDKLKLAGVSPTLEAANIAEEAEAERQATEARMGAFSNLAQSMVDRTIADMRKKGSSEWNIWAAKKVWDTTRWRIGDETFVKAYGAEAYGDQIAKIDAKYPKAVERGKERAVPQKILGKFSSKPLAGESPEAPTPQPAEAPAAPPVRIATKKDLQEAEEIRKRIKTPAEEFSERKQRADQLLTAKAISQEERDREIADAQAEKERKEREIFEKSDAGKATKQAQALAQKGLSPRERYEKRGAEIEEAHKTGRLSDEDYERALAAAEKERQSEARQLAPHPVRQRHAKGYLDRTAGVKTVGGVKRTPARPATGVVTRDVDRGEPVEVGDLVARPGDKVEVVRPFQRHGEEVTVGQLSDRRQRSPRRGEHEDAPAPKAPNAVQPLSEAAKMQADAARLQLEGAKAWVDLAKQLGSWIGNQMARQQSRPISSPHLDN